MSLPAMTHPEHLDAESREWLRTLGGAHGAERDRAVGRLHDLLLRAARFELHRRGSHDDDLANQAADDALVSILGKLDSYRGASRFTTWAYKFVLLEAGVKLRRRAWHGREIPLEGDALERVGALARPEHGAETAELLRAVTAAIDTELSPHQREVLVAVTLNDVPIDVLADRLGTTRGALYKSLHDARHKLRACLAARGFSSDPLEEATP